jgi:uncharacterized membrane protein
MVDVLYGMDNTLTPNDIYDAIEVLKQENLVVTRYRPILNQYHFHTYLTRNYASLPFWSVVAITALTLCLSVFIPSAAPWSIVRYIVGGAFILIMPGYSILLLLFPTKDISNMERLALSMGLSLVLIPLIGLLFAYSAFGIQLHPLVIFLSVLCISLSMTATYRNFLNSRIDI